MTATVKRTANDVVNEQVVMVEQDVNAEGGAERWRYCYCFVSMPTGMFCAMFTLRTRRCAYAVQRVERV